MLFIIRFGGFLLHILSFSIVVPLFLSLSLSVCFLPFSSALKKVLDRLHSKTEQSEYLIDRRTIESKVKDYYKLLSAQVSEFDLVSNHMCI